MKIMDSKKPLILISNDDGYHSNGIRTLVSFLADFAQVVVCAPEAARSGFSCAFSVVDYLLLKKRHNIPGCEVWSCTGTPVDCVKLALDQIFTGRKPDLILGGINHGDNSSVNNHYSGTMGIAYEGCMKYIPSIAFSSCDYDPNADLSYLRGYVRTIVRKVLAEGLPKGICLPEDRKVRRPESLPHGVRQLDKRSCTLQSSPRIRLLLDDGTLPQRRTRSSRQ